MKKVNETEKKAAHICEAAEKSKEQDIDVLGDLAELYKVFGDLTRVRILCALTAGEMCVIHLAEKLDMGQSAVSHQLRILRSAGLVRPRREGRTAYYSLDDEHVDMILEAGLEHIIQQRSGK